MAATLFKHGEKCADRELESDGADTVYMARKSWTVGFDTSVVDGQAVAELHATDHAAWQQIQTEMDEYIKGLPDDTAVRFLRKPRVEAVDGGFIGTSRLLCVGADAHTKEIDGDQRLGEPAIINIGEFVIEVQEMKGGMDGTR